MFPDHPLACQHRESGGLCLSSLIPAGKGNICIPALQFSLLGAWSVTQDIFTALVCWDYKCTCALTLAQDYTFGINLLLPQSPMHRDTLGLFFLSLISLSPRAFTCDEWISLSLKLMFLSILVTAGGECETEQHAQALPACEQHWLTKLQRNKNQSPLFLIFQMSL